MPSPLQQALQSLEACMAELGPELKALDPALIARAGQLKKALESGRPSSAEVERLAKELLVSSLARQQAELERQLAGVSVLAPRAPAAQQSKRALEAALALLGDAATLARGAAPAPATVLQFRARAREVAGAMKRANEAAAHSTAGLPMRPIFTQPVSSSGVRLKPVQPKEPKQKQNLVPFKLRSGVLPRS